VAHLAPVRTAARRLTVAAAIEVIDLHKTYGEHEAVKGISFSVAEGELLALLGPNGAGKTTTVEILEGYRTRSSGEVRVLGEDPARTGTALRERIGIVLQSSGIDRFLSVREVVEMYAGYYRTPRPVDEVIELVGLEEKRDDRVRTLSGGQQRRLDVALGLVGDPDLLFLDEPTTGFDPTARRQAWHLVQDLKALGKTVLLTTHYMDEAQTLADRIVIMSNGRIVAEGSPDEIGGRVDRGATVRFRVAASLPVPPMGAELADDGTWFFTSTDPTSDLHQLTGWAISHGGRLDALSVTPPSLEDVYLELTDGDAE
jgi:ABC-2 type transport system ATP-binding protein